MVGEGGPAVLVFGVIEHAPERLKELEASYNIIYPKATNRQDLIQELQTSHVFKQTSTIAVFRTFDSVKVTGRIDAELIKHFPLALRFISHVGAGYDQIDVAACTEAGIFVSNTPSVVDDSTSDIAIILILGAVKGLNFGLTTLRRGAWRGANDPDNGGLMPFGNDPRGKVLGILGMGGIGQATRDKASVFGMHIQYFNRRQLPAEQEKGAKYVTFEELLKTSDVVFVSLPLNQHTRHIISTNEFALMKKGAVLVNVARGAIVDEEALVNALDSGKIRSCGLDVFENEPKIHEGLMRNPNVLLVPHMGTWTVETQKKMELCAFENVASALETGQFKNLVPEQQKEPPKPRSSA